MTFIRQRLLPSEAAPPLLEPEPEPEPVPEPAPRIEIVAPGARSEPEAAAMPTPLASAAALAHPDIELSEGAWAGCKAVRTDETKSRWVTALFGGPMDPSQGPFTPSLSRSNCQARLKLCLEWLVPL